MALKARMQHSHEQHLADMSAMRAKIDAQTAQLNDGHSKIQHLIEENKRLQELVNQSQSVHILLLKNCNIVYRF